VLVIGQAQEYIHVFQSFRPREQHVLAYIRRDQPNSRFHGRDIFREIRDFFVNFNAFTFICEGFRVSSAAFVRILLFAMCHT